MEILFEKYYKKQNYINFQFSRYLLHTIDWNDRLIGIKGARGAGKTTLLFHYIKKGQLPNDGQTLYVSLDDLYFTENKLYDLGARFEKKGGKYLLLDEVHRYENWSQEIKNLYDDFPNLRIIFTGSSLIHLERAKGDLSRRAVMYELYGLSYREYLNLSLRINFESFKLSDLLYNHVEIAREINRKIKPLAHLRDYFQYGYYPYFIENKNTYSTKLAETINLALNLDLPTAYSISYGSIEKIRLLLYILAESVPFKPNISKLSERIGISRNLLIEFIKYLEEIRVIKRLYTSVKGIGALQKPDKIYLHHPNLQFALVQKEMDTGTARESFFLNQVAVHHDVSYPSEGDFCMNNTIFEIGGRNKTRKQIRGTDDAHIVLDDIEIGSRNKIPLWLFGFLY